MNTAVASKEVVRLGESEALLSFKEGVDSLLARRKYFIEQVLPSLKENQDYYTIRNKKCLAKGGAEKLASIYHLTASFERDHHVMEAFGDMPGLIAFTCNLFRNGLGVGQGRGAALLDRNGGDPNKTIKMATKSAYVDGVIRSAGLSDIFTQDIEDADILPAEAPREPLISDRQLELLTALVCQNIHNEDQKEAWLGQLPELTKKEASEQISSFIGTK